MSRTVRYRLLALDVDGTLVNSRDELTPRTTAALREASAAGVRIVLATGRRYRRVLPLAEALEIDAPLVTASGALIKRPSDHATLYCADLAGPTLERLLGVVAARGHEAVLYGDTFHEGFDFYCMRPHCHRVEAEFPELAEYLLLNAGSERVWPALMTAPPPAIFAGFATGTRAAMLELHEALQAAVPETLYTHVLRSPRYKGYMCEIAPAGVTKWSGIRHLAAEWGIGADAICAVGDDVNDLPMIEAAGLGVAMGNAQPEVLAAADRIAPCHDEDGLVEVVRWLLEEA